MRIDKLTIGSPKGSSTHKFKNLKDVTIDFDENHWVTVVIGWNGTGKSNVLEALAIIFRDLITKKRIPEFAFKLAYRIGTGESLRHIHIDADPDRTKNSFIIHAATDAEARGEGTLIPFLDSESSVSALRGKTVKLSTFCSEDQGFLPRYVFSYYSGESTRMHEVFRPYLESYDSKLRNGEDPGLKRLFYAMPVHSQFVLLAFLIRQPDVVREFLDEHLGIDPDEGIESVLFVLRQPPWKSNANDGDSRFWNARGVVSDFLARLNDIALAPIQVKRRVPVSLWNKKELEFQYMYVKDIDALKRLVGEQSPANFFRDLESTYVSELIEEVRIRVRLKKNDGTVTFRELSEGEQQLLTVLGLLRFTAEEESLFLLDEPDTHLNPKWSVDYIQHLKNFVNSGGIDENTSHIVLTTHNPLAVAELKKEQVQILHREGRASRIKSAPPEVDPRGMGYSGIITSDLFGLGSSLDKSTTQALLKLHELSTKDAPLDKDEKISLKKARDKVQSLDFNFASDDRLEREFTRARFDLAKSEGLDFDDPILTKENTEKALAALVTSLLDSLAGEQKK